MYDDPVENIHDFKKKVRKVFEAWENLEESYDKDMMICRLHCVLKDIEFGLNTDSLNDEIEMVENEYKIVQMNYQFDPIEDAEFEDFKL